MLNKHIDTKLKIVHLQCVFIIFFLIDYVPCIRFKSDFDLIENIGPYNVNKSIVCLKPFYNKIWNSPRLMFKMLSQCQNPYRNHNSSILNIHRTLLLSGTWILNKVTFEIWNPHWFIKKKWIFSEIS